MVCVRVGVAVACGLVGGAEQHAAVDVQPFRGRCCSAAGRSRSYLVVPTIFRWRLRVKLGDGCVRLLELMS